MIITDYRHSNITIRVHVTYFEDIKKIPVLLTLGCRSVAIIKTPATKRRNIAVIEHHPSSTASCMTPIKTITITSEYMDDKIAANCICIKEDIKD